MGQTAACAQLDDSNSLKIRRPSREGLVAYMWRKWPRPFTNTYIQARAFKRDQLLHITKIFLRTFCSFPIAMWLVPYCNILQAWMCALWRAWYKACNDSFFNGLFPFVILFTFDHVMANPSVCLQQNFPKCSSPKDASFTWGRQWNVAKLLNYRS